MARPATLLAKVDARRDTKDRAKLHAKDAQRQYRAALLEAFEGGLNVTELHRHVGTSWSRMAQLIDQAKAERAGLGD